MLLHINKNNIKYIIYNQKTRFDTNVEDASLTDLVWLNDFGDTEHSYIWYNADFYSSSYLYYKNGKIVTTPVTAKGIYLGDSTCINNKINSKHRISSQLNLKKIYFDPTSEYPRRNLNSLTNIKRCLDPSKADAIVISDKISFETYEVSSLVSSKKIKDVLILYSSSKNCYYFIDYIIDKILDPNKSSYFNSVFNKYKDPNLEGLYGWASMLINGSVLPNDCKQIYYGSVVLLSNIKEVEFIENLQTKYSDIMYDSDLNEIVANNQLELTEDSVVSLGKMILSTNLYDITLGIKLLSLYNIKKYQCIISIYLLHNWKIIKESNIYNSKSFNYILSILEIKKEEVYEGFINYIIDKLYLNSTNSKDKELSRNFIKDSIIKKLYSVYNGSLKDSYPNMNFTAKFTLE